MSTPAYARPEGLVADLLAVLDGLDTDLVDVRRDLHAHPELSGAEVRTTRLVTERLAAVGVRTRALSGTGLIADLGPDTGPVIALRADLDALPVADRTDDDWRSTVPEVAHACGHDVHTAALLGVGLALAGLEDRLPGPVRLVFQPAEEVMDGGATGAIADGALADVARIFAVHCDPTIDVGGIGLRTGPLTGAADALRVELSGTGGHTSRPHLTQDLTFALGTLVTQLPAVLSRRLDPRAGASLVWGCVQAGTAMNVIPDHGVAGGTLRMLDAGTWEGARALVEEVVPTLVEPYGVTARITYQRGVPPVVNEPLSTALLEESTRDLFGPGAVRPTVQSLGGEDFSWYLEKVPGAMARLGTRSPGGPTYDLHQGNLRIDDRAVGIAARLLGRVALAALDAPWSR